MTQTPKGSKKSNLKINVKSTFSPKKKEQLSPSKIKAKGELSSPSKTKPKEDLVENSRDPEVQDALSKLADSDGQPSIFDMQEDQEEELSED